MTLYFQYGPHLPDQRSFPYGLPFHVENQKLVKFAYAFRLFELIVLPGLILI